MASRYKISIKQIEPEKLHPKIKKVKVPPTYERIRASLIGRESHFDWMEKSGHICNVHIVDKLVGISYSSLNSMGFSLIRAEFDIINPKSAWTQKHFKRLTIKGEKGFEVLGTYDNDFKIVYPKNLEQLENLPIDAIKEHLQKYYEQEWETALGTFSKEECSKGGKHEWGTDGQHSKEYCKKCFKSKASYKAEK